MWLLQLSKKQHRRRMYSAPSKARAPQLITSWKPALPIPSPQTSKPWNPREAAEKLVRQFAQQEEEAGAAAAVSVGYPRQLETLFVSSPEEQPKLIYLTSLPAFEAKNRNGLVDAYNNFQSVAWSVPYDAFCKIFHEALDKLSVYCTEENIEEDEECSEEDEEPTTSDDEFIVPEDEVSPVKIEESEEEEVEVDEDDE